MNILKKLISVCLASALTLSSLLMYAGASSTDSFSPSQYYSDSDEITYGHAVSVVTGYQMFVGTATADSGSEFRPHDLLNRAEAAKLISFANLGPDDAMGLLPNETRFSDLKNYEWASGFIRYCSDKGIINGVGNEFGEILYNPAGNLTHYEMLKLLVCSLGYGARNECVGVNWKLAVAGFAKSAGLTSGLEDSGSFDFNKQITREEAALYLYNALLSDMVSYSEVFTRYLPRSQSGETVINTEDATTLLETLGGRSVRGRIDYHEGDGFVITDNRDGFVHYIKVNAHVSDYGRDGYVYVDKNNNTVTEVDFTDNLMASIYHKTSYEAMTDKNNPDYAGKFASFENFTLIKDGVATPAGISEIDECVSANGHIFNILDTNGDNIADKAISVIPKAAVMSQNYELKNNRVYIKGIIPNDGIDAGSIYGFRNLEPGAVVLVYTLNTPSGVVTFIERAARVQGRKTATLSEKDQTLITVDNKDYAVSGLKYTATAGPSNRPNAIGSSSTWIMSDNRDVTLYLDRGGFILHTSAH